MEKFNEIWNKAIDFATVKPQYLLAATTVGVCAWLGDEWYQRYQADSEIRELVGKLKSLEQSEIRDALKSIARYAKDAETKEIASEYGAIREILKLLSGDVTELHEPALDSLNSVLDNTAESRDCFLSNGGISTLVKLSSGKLRVKVCDILSRVTAFDTVVQMLPDDIPFGSEGGRYLSQLNDVEFSTLFKIFVEGKPDTIQLITRIFANGCLTNAFSKRLSRYENAFAVTACLSNITSGSKSAKIRVDSLIILAGIAQVDFEEHRDLFYTASNPEKILSNVTEKEAEFSILQIYNNLVDNAKGDEVLKMSRILVHHQAWTKKLFGLLEERTERIKRRANQLLESVDDLPTEFSEKIKTFAREERERIKKVREQEERKKEEDMQRQFSRMGGMFG